MVSWWKRLLSPTIEMLEAKIESQRTTIVRLENLCRATANECALQRVLIASLRDVNASLDARCNELERSRE